MWYEQFGGLMILKSKKKKVNIISYTGMINKLWPVNEKNEKLSLMLPHLTELFENWEKSDKTSSMYLKTDIRCFT